MLMNKLVCNFFTKIHAFSSAQHRLKQYSGVLSHIGFLLKAQVLKCDVVEPSSLSRSRVIS